MTRMTLIVLGLLLASWTPYIIATALPNVNPFVEPEQYIIYRYFDGVGTICASLYSFLNIFVYAGTHKDYKNAFSTMLGLGAKRDTEGSSTSRETKEDVV